MNTTCHTTNNARICGKQSGAVLIISLIILLVLTVLGVTAMQNTVLEERMAGNMRDMRLAFNASEAALRAGENTLNAVTLPAFDGTVAGYHAKDDNLWETSAFWDDMTNVIVHDVSTSFLDSATGRFLLESSPLYYLEFMNTVPSGTNASAEAGQTFDGAMYRVTARGVGGTNVTEAVLQTTFRR